MTQENVKTLSSETLKRVGELFGNNAMVLRDGTEVSVNDLLATIQERDARIAALEAELTALKASPPTGYALVRKAPPGLFRIMGNTLYVDKGQVGTTTAGDGYIAILGGADVLHYLKPALTPDQPPKSAGKLPWWCAYCGAPGQTDENGEHLLCPCRSQATFPPPTTPSRS